MEKILTQDSGMKKLSQYKVPHISNATDKKVRVDCSRAALKCYNMQPYAFINAIFTMDETWIPLYDPITRTESLEWVETRAQLSSRPTSSK